MKLSLNSLNCPSPSPRTRQTGIKSLRQLAFQLTSSSHNQRQYPGCNFKCCQDTELATRLGHKRKVSVLFIMCVFCRFVIVFADSCFGQMLLCIRRIAMPSNKKIVTNVSLVALAPYVFHVFARFFEDIVDVMRHVAICRDMSLLMSPRLPVSSGFWPRHILRLLEICIFPCLRVSVSPHVATHVATWRNMTGNVATCRDVSRHRCLPISTNLGLLYTP